MLTEQALHTLLDLDLPQGFPLALVYAEQKGERLDHVCRFIFNQVLKLNYQIVTSTEEFKAAKGLKVNYSAKEIEGIFRILPAGLLEKKGISESKPIPVFKNDNIYFYERPDNKDLPYDIFSAVFYFISRYEEWQSFEPDRHGRFEAAASILFPHKFHLKPVVDLWIIELAERLQAFYPGIKFPEQKFRVISTIDVDNLYAYRSKGLVRTLGASMKDLLKLDLKNLEERMKVLAGSKEDPFDIYDRISAFCLERRIPLIYFFLFRTGTAYDRTVDPDSPAFPGVFKRLKEKQAYMGIHPSYDSVEKEELLAYEKNKLSQKAGEDIKFSRQHFLRFKIRSTPKTLIKNGITADFSMGYASAPGFRAGTSHPFYYYDFEAEKAGNLLFVPFCVMDGVYTIYEQVPAEPAFKEMLAIAVEIKKVNGFFISVFHERSFSDHLYPGFGSLYKNLHSELKGM